jgi:hypothetical protein
MLPVGERNREVLLVHENWARTPACREKAECHTWIKGMLKQLHKYHLTDDCFEYYENFEVSITILLFLSGIGT